jgi:two-component system NtrC family sensor kinase
LEKHAASIAQTVNFDQELELSELLSASDLKTLSRTLPKLLDGPVRLLDANGDIIIGNNIEPASQRRELCIELEPVGFIEAEVDQSRLDAAALLIEQYLRNIVRYHMASRLHLETVHADYGRLQEKHQALQESEARYRNLAENLEQRVAEQVKTIESAHRQLYQAEKMASIGQLAAGMAHEINNPIGFVNSNIRTAQNYLVKFNNLYQQLQYNPQSLHEFWRQQDLDFVLEDFAGLLTESLQGVERVAAIVKDLKTFSNVDRAIEEEGDVNDTLRAVCSVAGTQFAPRVIISLNLTDLPRIRYKPGLLGQVFLNILNNAAAAIKAQGEITVSSDYTGGLIRIDIADDGCGMPQALVGKIFDPFFTTREVGQGTGLGLTASQDIVRAHNGRIEVHSEEGFGSCFSIILPGKE